MPRVTRSKSQIDPSQATQTKAPKAPKPTQSTPTPSTRSNALGADADAGTDTRPVLGWARRILDSSLTQQHSVNCI